MLTKIIEASSGMMGNWGRFMLMQYQDAERNYPTHYQLTTEDRAGRRIPGVPMTIWVNDYPPEHAVIWILDLITGEGATFDLEQELPEQLHRHQIWVCPLYQPFLVWLQGFVKAHRDELAPSYDKLLDMLPTNVGLPGIPVEIHGHRRPGPSDEGD